MKLKKKKIVHAPVNIGNQPYALACSEKKLGLNSQVIVNYNTWVNYPVDEVLRIEKKLGSLQDKLRRVFKSLYYVFSANVLHYYFGRSFFCWDDLGTRNKFWYSDLKLAKFLKKGLVMTLQGCDVRLAHQSDQNNAYTPCRKGECNAYQNCIDNYDHDRKFLIEKILPLMDHVFYLNPELGRFVKKGSFLPYCSVDVNNITVVPPRTQGKLTIVHAPSDASTKGTKYILAAISKLKDEHEFEFTLVQNKTHAEAMQIYASADLAIDQMLYGWYGAFAVELMAMGKPVVCYIREDDLHYIPQEMKADLPIINADPETLTEVLRKILENRNSLIEHSLKSVAYVKKWHNPDQIAREVQQFYPIR